MSANKTKVAVISGFLMLTSVCAAAPDDTGKREYLNNCAVCHGETGKGDGPYAGIIDTRVPDITMLQKANAGVFPYDRVYQMIDGRLDVRAHGSRDMPIWGNEYNAKAAEYYSDYIRQYNAEGFVRGKVLALINHVYSLQQQ
ncbi:MAG: cytochrome c [Paracoccaceae bacterium]|nr:cytochrome c [Paracoccaceae bacterium]